MLTVRIVRVGLHHYSRLVRVSNVLLSDCNAVSKRPWRDYMRTCMRSSLLFKDHTPSTLHHSRLRAMVGLIPSRVSNCGENGPIHTCTNTCGREGRQNFAERCVSMRGRLH